MFQIVCRLALPIWRKNSTVYGVLAISVIKLTNRHLNYRFNLTLTISCLFPMLRKRRNRTVKILLANMDAGYFEFATISRASASGYERTKCEMGNAFEVDSNLRFRLGRTLGDCCIDGKQLSFQAPHEKAIRNTSANIIAYESVRCLRLLFHPPSNLDPRVLRLFRSQWQKGLRTLGPRLPAKKRGEKRQLEKCLLTQAINITQDNYFLSKHEL